MGPGIKQLFGAWQFDVFKQRFAALSGGLAA
jgi:hypothetical protein